VKLAVHCWAIFRDFLRSPDIWIGCRGGDTGLPLWNKPPASAERLLLAMSTWLR
jgi:hypothetical protein